MKLALELSNKLHREIEEKRIKRDCREKEIADARKGILKSSFWEKWITIPRLKRNLKKNIYVYYCGGEYNWELSPYHLSLDRRGINYVCYLLESEGFLNIEILEDARYPILTKIRGTLPKTVAELILYGQKQNT
jgi:hypothetical protein